MSDFEKDWRQLEILVAQIQKELAPGAIVEHNVRVKGFETGEMRQIDVLVKQKIGQYEMLIAIDCKDYKSPADVKDVEQFRGLITDIRANKGALVCPRGFTRTAKKRARGFNIDLYSPVDTDPHKWQVKPTLPMICDFRSVAIAFGIRCSAPGPFTLSHDFYRSLKVFDGSDQCLGTSLEVSLARWSRGEYPIDPGEHDDVQIFPNPETLVDNGHGQRIPVTLYASLLIKQNIYFGYLPISRMRGLKDEQTGAIVTNAFTTGKLDAEEVENKWKKLKPGEEPPIRPVMKVVGLDCYEVGEK